MAQSWPWGSQIAVKKNYFKDDESGKLYPDYCSLKNNLKLLHKESRLFYSIQTVE